MVIRRARPDDDLSSLWRLCFGEDGGVFFDHEYDSARALVTATDADEPVSMLHYIPQILKWREDAIPAAYILGIGTRQDCRGRGYAADLIRQAFHVLHRLGYPLAFLLPGEDTLHEYYARLGFRAMGLLPHAPRLAPVLPPLTKPDADRLSALYEAMCGDMPHPLRDSDRWEVIGRDYDLRGEAGRYQIWEGRRLLEDSSGRSFDPHPCGANVKVLDWQYFLKLADARGRALPVRTVHDPHAPWNGMAHTMSPEAALLDGVYLYANALYNA